LVDIRIDPRRYLVCDFAGRIRKPTKAEQRILSHAAKSLQSEAGVIAVAVSAIRKGGYCWIPTPQPRTLFGIMEAQP